MSIEQRVNQLITQGSIANGERMIAKAILILEDAGISIVNVKLIEIQTVYAKLQAVKAISGTAKPASISDKRSKMTAFVAKHIDEYRHCFAVKVNGQWRSLRPGSMGSRQACVKKMCAWIANNDYAYKWEDIINCAKSYVETQRGNSFKYLQQADYFIDKFGQSRLSALIEDSIAATKSSSSQQTTTHV